MFLVFHAESSNGGMQSGWNETEHDIVFAHKIIHEIGILNDIDTNSSDATLIGNRDGGAEALCLLEHCRSDCDLVVGESHQIMQHRRSNHSTSKQEDLFLLGFIGQSEIRDVVVFFSETALIGDHSSSDFGRELLCRLSTENLRNKRSQSVAERLRCLNGQLSGQIVHTEHDDGTRIGGDRISSNGVLLNIEFEDRIVNAGGMTEKLDASIGITADITDNDQVQSILLAQLACLLDGDEPRILTTPKHAIDENASVGKDVFVEARFILVRIVKIVLHVEWLQIGSFASYDVLRLCHWK